MKLRCELHLSPTVTRVILVPKPEEKLDHLAMKLAAVAMFHEAKPIVEPSSSHASLTQADHKPDLMILNAAGDITHWIECGSVTVNKLHKVRRRFPSARIVVIKPILREAQRLRDDLVDAFRDPDSIEIWTWPEGRFQEWLQTMDEKTEIFGEAYEKSFNLVVNNHAYAVELMSV